MIFSSKGQQGIALVVTLLAVVLITALVVEFAYGVYIGTNNLYNWRDSQRLSLMARSGVNISAQYLSKIKHQTYSYPGIFEVPAGNPFEDFNGKLSIRIEDENSKFNLNDVVYPGGKKRNDAAYYALSRLLKNLALDERIADRLVDWIDKDSLAELADSEKDAKNLPLDSVDELLLIPGLTKHDYTTLLPYTAALKPRDNFSININGAEKPVIMCLSDKITDTLAQAVIDWRRNTPFTAPGELNNVAGFGGSLEIPASAIAVTGEYFLIQSVAASGGIKRVITAIFNNQDGEIRYWKEY
jgi:general secretion pathway protein K